MSRKATGPRQVETKEHEMDNGYKITKYEDEEFSRVTCMSLEALGWFVIEREPGLYLVRVETDNGISEQMIEIKRYAIVDGDGEVVSGNIVE
jgi:hypothetical protein